MKKLYIAAFGLACAAVCAELQAKPALAVTRATPKAETKTEAPKKAAKKAVAKAAETKTSLSKAVPAGWLEDFELAKKTAKKEQKKIFLAFSGSDWCGWCIKLDKEVYGQKEFLDLVSKAYVPVLIDLPRDKSSLSELGQKQNRELASSFKVRGFPCGVICNAEGEELGRIGGYVKGGPSAYLAEMDKKSR